MNTTPPSPTRRAVLWAITIVVALATSAVLAGCGTGTTSTADATAGNVATSTGPTPGATSDGVASSTVVMVIRHGEKPDGSNPGVDAQGNHDDSSLTAIGWNRANRLADLFDPAQGPPQANVKVREFCVRLTELGHPAARLHD
jgi:hypothetical protein